MTWALILYMRQKRNKCFLYVNKFDKKGVTIVTPFVIQELYIIWFHVNVMFEIYTNKPY